MKKSETLYYKIPSLLAVLSEFYSPKVSFHRPSVNILIFYDARGEYGYCFQMSLSFPLFILNSLVEILVYPHHDLVAMFPIFCDVFQNEARVIIHFVVLEIFMII